LNFGLWLAKGSEVLRSFLLNFGLWLSEILRSLFLNLRLRLSKFESGRSRLSRRLVKSRLALSGDNRLFDCQRLLWSFCLLELLLCFTCRGTEAELHHAFMLLSLTEIIVSERTSILLRDRNLRCGLIESFNLLSHNGELAWIQQLGILEFVAISILSGEVKNKIPLIIVGVELGISHVLIQSGVGQVVRAKSEIVRALNDGIVVGIQIDSGVVQISASKLGTSNMDCAIVTVSEEDRSLDWAEEESGVLTLVNCDLRYEKERLQ